jgi:hypothetical protein
LLHRHSVQLEKLWAKVLDTVIEKAQVRRSLANINWIEVLAVAAVHGYKQSAESVFSSQFLNARDDLGFRDGGQVEPPHGPAAVFRRRILESGVSESVIGGLVDGRRS